MENHFFKSLESQSVGDAVAFERAVEQLGFNEQGLIPAIAQQYDTGEVLMMAWMNRESLLETLAQHRVCYWSRSRQQLWRKGESSGHTQKLVEMRWDCDGDTILCLVDQQGPACHTHRRSCFYLSVQGEQLTMITDAEASTKTD